MSEQPDQQGRPSGQPDPQRDRPAGQQPSYGSSAPGYGSSPSAPSGSSPAPGPGYGFEKQAPAPGYGHPGQQGQHGYGQQPPAPGYGHPGQQGYGQPKPELSPPDQRLWACLAHISAIVAGVLLSGITVFTIWLGFVGPLVVFLVLKDRGIFVRRQAVEALNFSILTGIVYSALAVLGWVTSIIGIGLLLFPVAWAVAVVALVFTIIAAVKANQGVDYRYPVNWRLVR